MIRAHNYTEGKSFGMAKFQRCLLVLFVIFVIYIAYVECTSCTQYKLGGVSKIHYYTCCRNPDEDCDGKTYQGGGSKEPTEDYCDPGGVATGGGVVDFVFCCGSCAQQDYCEAKCDYAWFGLLKVTPCLCGAWSRCFRNCCKKSQTNSTNSTDGVVEVDEFCADGVCQEGENNSTCPTDCWEGSECDYECNSSEDEGSFGAGTHIHPLALLVPAVLVLSYGYF